jgi:hypothetical protein
MPILCFPPSSAAGSSAAGPQAVKRMEMAIKILVTNKNRFDIFPPY